MTKAKRRKCSEVTVAIRIDPDRECWLGETKALVVLDRSSIEELLGQMDQAKAMAGEDMTLYGNVFFRHDLPFVGDVNLDDEALTRNRDALSGCAPLPGDECDVNGIYVFRGNILKKLGAAETERIETVTRVVCPDCVLWRAYLKHSDPPIALETWELAKVYLNDILEVLS